MLVLNNSLTVGEIRKQLEGQSDDTPVLVYDENKARYQDVCEVKSDTYRHEDRYEILPPANKKNMPFLEEGSVFLLLIGWGIEV